ncbi:fumarylacetoacetate hydrolase family protein [Afifella sp. IM 167]|uniref:fumarylacetoacetate hydrolase family protein n=1 Tax=Afifella sp. IM 167 TaxID=2033586 RepID=UPI001CCBCC42|nr:fumarylacetoacetate hydrolase family protein [Afifella sp. IM 167]MBZ8133735.1 5-oxopent-3-ene-1,2,5-tricarboxylate decarboxylase [Afifella sp. IM 167]
MRYLVFESHGEPRLGALVNGDTVIDITEAVPGNPRSVRALVEGGPALEKALQARLGDADLPRQPLAGVKLLSPLPDASKMICLGLNYADHAKEGGHAVPDYPALFLRASSSMIGPDEPMIVPKCSERLDYEAELVIVVGERCRHVKEEDALDVIFGFTAFNDGSIRDYQKRTAQWTAGKNFDGTGSLGPWIVTKDELPAGAKGLTIRSRLNGRIMQESNTERMIFSVPKTIAILSEIMTLEPGDLIATGTPDGVGHARKPPVWMRPGDEITVEIDQIGTLRNPIAAEVETPDLVTA